MFSDNYTLSSPSVFQCKGDEYQSPISKVKGENHVSPLATRNQNNQNPSLNVQKLKIRSRKVFEQLSGCIALDSKSITTLSTNREENFFTHRQPDQWFNFGCNRNGKISVNLPDEISNQAKVIYIFENTVTGKSLIGKTGGRVSSRLSSYLTTIDSQKSSEFLNDIRKSPSKFRFGILYRLALDEDLNEYETKFINYKRNIIPLYNQRNGGAGGSARSEEIKTKYFIPDPKTITPEKRYPFRMDKKGKIRPFYSPNTQKKLKKIKKYSSQGFVYSILQHSTGKRYIGTSGKPLKRGREHAYASEFFCRKNRKKFTPLKKDGALHPALGKNPNDFSIGILPIVYKKSQLKKTSYKVVTIASSLGEVEKVIIHERKTLSPHGFNLNRGGGGPIATPKKA